jgi:hypothetical protein
MSLFILTETSAGYALLKSKDKKLFKRESLPEDANTAEGISNLYVQLPLLQKKKRPFGQAKHPAQPAQKILVAVDNGTDFLRVASS